MANQRHRPVVILSSEEMSRIAKNVAKKMKTLSDRYTHLDVEYKSFANGEIAVHIPETIRSKEVYFFHSLYYPDVNTSIMKMLLTNNAIALAAPRSLVLVLLYIPYLRQDRKDQPRVPISARLIADIIEQNRAVKRVITMDMHADQEQGFFSIPVDNLRGGIMCAEYFKTKYGKKLSEFMVVAPDFGAAVRAERFAKRIGENVPVAILQKERKPGGLVETHALIGESPEGKQIILFDDMIDSGNTIIAAAKALRERGAKDIHICVTHGIFSPSGGTSAEQKFAEAKIHVVVTDTIPRSEEYQKKNASWLTMISTENLLANVLAQSDSYGGSVSKLF